MVGLHIESVSKRYGKVQALDSVTLDFAPGEVHALLGENGAGKSTLVNLIGGLTTSDSGSLTLNGVPIPTGRRNGIGVVHQHFTLVPDFSVAENIALFRLPKLAAKLDLDQLAKPALEKASELGWQIEPTAKIRQLPVGAQQRVEILKCLSDDQRLLVFDEPTAPLGPDEVADLLGILRKLAEEGRIVILVAHKLAEVLAVANRISVLRLGKVVAANLDAREVTTDALARMMVGELPLPLDPGPPHSRENPLIVENLSVKGDRGEAAIRNLNFFAARGYILGIGGVDGNGQTELAEALAGIRSYDGVISLSGKLPEAIGYIPEDRHADGLALGMSVSENLLLGRLQNWPRRKEIKPWVSSLVKRYEVKTSDPEEGVSGLSGGNQQKLVVARALDAKPELVVAINPTRGLDVRATRFVHDQLKHAAFRGAVVILISADIDELHGVADEIRFLSRGEFTEGSGATAVVGGP